MKSQKKILIAFILNAAFSLFEFLGGAFTNSIAITSDAVHDLGDAVSIGISYFLEKKSKKEPDKAYTYGYARYSVLGSVITTCILIVGSLAVIYNAVLRIINPVDINYSGMIGLALVGVTVNFIAAYFTSGGDSLNQKAVNLHMLEDVLGWIVVLLGAVIMRVCDIKIIDPLMSIAVSLFILFSALKNLKSVLDLFLEKTPGNIDIEEIEHHLKHIEGVCGVHHIHIWSLDGNINYATMHIVCEGDTADIKQRVRENLSEHGISHTTLELEKTSEECGEHNCHIEFKPAGHHHHHH